MSNKTSFFFFLMAKPIQYCKVRCLFKRSAVDLKGQPGLSTLCLKYFELGLLLLVGNTIPTSDLRQSAWVLRRMGSLGVAAEVLDREDFITFPDSSVGKKSTCNAGDPSSIPGLGRSTQEGIGYPLMLLGFPGGLADKESACNEGDLGSIPGLGRSPGEGKGYPLQYSILENSMDCVVHGVAKSRIQLSDLHLQFSLISFQSSVDREGLVHTPCFLSLQQDKSPLLRRDKLLCCVERCFVKSRQIDRHTETPVLGVHTGSDCVTRSHTLAVSRCA